MADVEGSFARLSPGMSNAFCVCCRLDVCSWHLDGQIWQPFLPFLPNIKSLSKQCWELIVWLNQALQSSLNQEKINQTLNHSNTITCSKEEWWYIKQWIELVKPFVHNSKVTFQMAQKGGTYESIKVHHTTEIICINDENKLEAFHWFVGSFCTVGMQKPYLKAPEKLYAMQTYFVKILCKNR